MVLLVLGSLSGHREAFQAIQVFIGSKDLTESAILYLGIEG
jgi:hypothetical protein